MTAWRDKAASVVDLRRRGGQATIGIRCKGIRISGRLYGCHLDGEGYHSPDNPGTALAGLRNLKACMQAGTYLLVVQPARITNRQTFGI
jgi:hypothetical protein